MGKDSKCNAPVEVYQRVTGFWRPISCWNIGKKEEWKHRKLFKTTESMGSE